MHVHIDQQSQRQLSPTAFRLATGSAAHSSDASAPRPIVNAFTADVEDYYHVSGFADRIAARDWDSYESRVVTNTHRLLKLLDRHQVRGTFFVLGWVADRYPQLVRDIQRAGHEIGCHSFWHRLIYDMTPDEFEEDLTLGQKVLEEITGEAVVAYRSPSFSITARSLWALDILVENGFQYDSSIFPIYHDRYGIPGAKRFPSVMQLAAGDLCEFPPSVCRVCGFNVPISGGGYFRLLPLPLSLRWLGQINHRANYPFMFYIHPWEIDPDQPRLAGSRGSRFRHYANLATTERKLNRLLDTFQFASLGDVLNRSSFPNRQSAVSSRHSGNRLRIRPT